MNRRVQVFSVPRLIAGLAVVALLFVPAYFFLIRQPADANVQRVAMLDTVSGAELDVGLDLGDQAPDFEFSTPEGQRARLSDFEGRPTVIAFWATWCTSCLSEMPSLKALQERLGLDTFNVVAVNAGQTRPKAEEFIDYLDAPFVYAMDPSMTLTDAYGVYGLPLSVYLDSKGVVRGVYRGHATPEILDTYVTAAINAEPPGDVPGVVRLVSTIERPHILTISTTGAGNLSFTSKALRCDLTYCAHDAIETAFAGKDGVTGLSFAEDASGEPMLTIDFDASLVRDDVVVSTITSALEGLDDPLYVTPLQVQFQDE